MGLKKLAAKLLDYNKRLESGKADQIKQTHLVKVLDKLQAKEAELEADLACANNEQKKSRLERKIRIAREQIARANWLMKEISHEPPAE
ncbi:MAG: hypothetical protein V2I51_03340 [Anderseniella sp.]|jgi:predicted  nucleic acid-binding Zn-ribbon protein|nr:hypothetical protein [Anderseniella sp.]